MIRKIFTLSLVLSSILCLCSCSVSKSTDTQSTVDAQQESISTKNSDNSNDTVQKTTDSTDEIVTSQNPDESEPAESVDDSKETLSHMHNYEDATCTAPKTCDCGETVGKELGHSYVAATCTSAMRCSRCGSTSGDAIGHSFTDGTCTTSKYCTLCGETAGEPLGHIYNEATCTIGKTCEVCGDVLGEGMGHQYVDDICSRCGETDPKSLGTSLNSLHVIACSKYKYSDVEFTDTFGYKYKGAYLFNDIRDDNTYIDRRSYAVYNTEKAYKTLSGSIVTGENVGQNETMVVYIFVDDQLVYTSPVFGRTTGKIDFSVDISNAQKVEIRGGRKTGSESWAHFAIVDANVK